VRDVGMTTPVTHAAAATTVIRMRRDRMTTLHLRGMPLDHILDIDTPEIYLEL